MTGITKQEAATLWGNGFKLQDKEGNVWRIIEIFEPNRIGIYNESKPMDGYACKRHISYSELGSDYFIIARPLSQLTQEIEHEGKMVAPIVELAVKVLAQKFRYGNEHKIEEIKFEPTHSGMMLRFKEDYSYYKFIVEYNKDAERFGFYLTRDNDINYQLLIL